MLLLYPLFRSLRNTFFPPRIYLLLAAIPLVIDFALTFFGVWENTHTSRLLTGALIGSVAVFYVMPGIIDVSLRAIRAQIAASAPVTFTLASPEQNLFRSQRLQRPRPSHLAKRPSWPRNNGPCTLKSGAFWIPL